MLKLAELISSQWFMWLIIFKIETLNKHINMYEEGGKTGIKHWILKAGNSFSVMFY